jgi:hypothetical protein
MRLILAGLVCTVLAFAAFATMKSNPNWDSTTPYKIFSAMLQSLPHAPSTPLPSQPGSGGSGGFALTSPPLPNG